MTNEEFADAVAKVLNNSQMTAPGVERFSFGLAAVWPDDTLSRTTKNQMIQALEAALDVAKAQCVAEEEWTTWKAGESVYRDGDSMKLTTDCNGEVGTRNPADPSRVYRSEVLYAAGWRALTLRMGCQKSQAQNEMTPSYASTLREVQQVQSSWSPEKRASADAAIRRQRLADLKAYAEEEGI